LLAKFKEESKDESYEFDAISPIKKSPSKKSKSPTRKSLKDKVAAEA